MRITNEYLNSENLITDSNGTIYAFYVNGGDMYAVRSNDGLTVEVIEPSTTEAPISTLVHPNEANIALDLLDEIVTITDINSNQDYGLEIDGVVITNVVELD